jgi:sulfur-oxidizing protein SoxY
MNRRDALKSGAGVAAMLLVQPSTAAGIDGDLRAAIDAYTGGKPLKEGRVKLDIAELIDNGNAVPIMVSVESPMSAADHVTAIAVFNEKNPQRDVVRFQLGPRVGKAQVTTRIRLATSQKLVAVATLSDGAICTHTVDVIVTLAACIED